MNLAFLYAAIALAQTDVPDDPTAFDMRCLIVASQLGSQAEGEMRNNVRMMAVFYFGRVDARIADEAELEARLVREELAMRNEDAAAHTAACGAFMAERGGLLSAMGRRIAEREQETHR